MFDWLRRLFGRESACVSAPARHAAPEAPGQSAAPEFLLREAVLDRQQHIRGYLFSIRRPPRQRAWEAASESFFDKVLVERLGHLDLPALTGRRACYLPLQPESLLLPELDALAKAQVVLCLTDGLPEDAGRLEAIAARARTLTELGATVACSHALAGGPLAPLIKVARLVTVEAASLAPPDLIELAHRLRKAYPDAGLLAFRVDSVELFDACQRLHFDFHQGRYLTAYREAQEPQLNSQRMVVTQLIGQLRHKETDYDKLALIARQDFALTFRLLRYINSAALGLRTKVGSLKQAMVYIGREGLYRWLTLLLFYNSKASRGDRALRETSLGRARMCELLARRGMAPAACEEAFVTGLLSLADVLFHMPMDKAIGQLDLPRDIHDALARHEGRYGTLLALTLACERGDTAAIQALGQPLALAAEQVNGLYLEALGWAVAYDQDLESEPGQPGQ